MAEGDASTGRIQVEQRDGIAGGRKVVAISASGRYTYVRTRPRGEAMMQIRTPDTNRRYSEIQTESAASRQRLAGQDNQQQIARAKQMRRTIELREVWGGADGAGKGERRICSIRH